MPQQKIKKRQPAASKAVHSSRQPAQQSTSNQASPIATLNPKTILQLQRTIGNKATTRLIQQRQQQEPVQRLAMTESPIDATNLTSIKNISGGATVNFLLTNAENQKLVIKFDKDPDRTVLGSQVHRKMGVTAPDTRRASQKSQQNIFEAVQKLENLTDFKQAISAFNDAYQGSVYTMLLMEYMPGTDANKLGKENPMTLMKAIQNKQFQQQLGHILATDMLTGEWDRMHIIKGSNDTSFHYKPGNLMIVKGANGSYQATAIDNDFKPKKLSFFLSGERNYGSMSVLNDDQLKEEVQALYKAMVPEQNYVKSWLSKLKLKIQIKSAEKPFIKSVMQSAQATLEQMLGRGQNWSEMLRGYGADDEQIKDFKIRRRFMRLIHDGMDKYEALNVSKDQVKYRMWVLTEQCKFKKKDAEEVLAMGDYVYKASVKESLKTGNSFNMAIRILIKEIGFSSEEAIKLMQEKPETIKRTIEESLKKGEPVRVTVINLT